MFITTKVYCPVHDEYSEPYYSERDEMPFEFTEPSALEIREAMAAEAAAHVAGRCLEFCGQCLDAHMVRSDWLGIEGVLLYEDHCVKEEQQRVLDLAAGCKCR